MKVSEGGPLNVDCHIALYFVLQPDETTTMRERVKEAIDAFTRSI